MALPIESYGYLPQLETYEGAACVPTSLSNAITALARANPNLLALVTEGEDITDEAISSLRDKLATQYFFTSKDARPSGSPTSINIKGLLDYVANVNLASRVQVWVHGPKDTSPAFQALGGWGESFSDLKVVPPDGKSFYKSYVAPGIDDPRISKIYKNGFMAQDIKDYLDSNSAVIVGLAYADNERGHAVAATNISWDDVNANNMIDNNESITLDVIDPLDPSISYSPQIGSPIVEGDPTKFAPLVQATGPAKITKITLTQKDDGISFIYNQQSVVNKEGALGYDGDPQLGSNGQQSGGSLVAEGTIAFIGGLIARAGSIDRITGTSDADTLESDPGRQLMTGGAGGDTFVVGDPEQWQKSASDVITDFNPNQNDVIALRGDELGLDALKLVNVGNKEERKDAASSNANLIYQSPKTSDGKGGLFLDGNGSKRGLGDDGGCLVKLVGVDELSVSDLHLLR